MRSAPAGTEKAPDPALEILRNVRRIEIRSRRLVQELFSGSYHTVFKGRGIEFSEVRGYVPGDDIRSIDWNVTARMGHPYVKLFHEERERSVVFLVDRSASTRFGSSRRTLSLAAAEATALLAFSAAVNQDKVGLLLYSDRTEKWVPPKKGRPHVLRLLREVLEEPEPDRGTRLGAGLEQATRMLRRRTILFVVSDFLVDPEELRHPLAVAARKHEVVPLVLVDPRQERHPAVGLVPVFDLETGRRAVVDTSDPRTRAALEARTRAMAEERERVFRRAGVEGVELRLDEDTVAPLVAYFRRRERWRAAGR
ncbi:MAG: DUF58 domain-containing protein [Candidatus Eisenbacteria bacterium]|nr:DUF58 domain-containing protein [Candidatus Latescibacterota bacterium]MBD3302511.1 DUF58 domain-containing protein [Candidatus Eisenbacteria bacterium]